MSSAPTTRAASGRSEPVTDRPGFGAAVRPHLGWLYALARRLVGDPETAEDLVQRCLLQAHRTDGDLDDPDALPACLKQTLVNCAQDHRRAEGRESRERSFHGLDDDPPYQTSTAVDPFPSLSGFDIDDLDAVLARLRAIYRMPLVLVHMEGYTTAEVAELLDTSQDTVLARLHRGRQQFERQLWDYGQERGLLVDMRANSGRAQPST